MLTETDRNTLQAASFATRDIMEQAPATRKDASLLHGSTNRGILSVRIDTFTFEEVITRVRQFLNQDGLHTIATVNPEFVIAAQSDDEFLRILNSTHINVVDGIGVQLAMRLLHGKVCERVTGVDLTWALAKLAAQERRSVFLLGSGAGVASKAANRLKQEYPELQIAGCYAGSPDEEGIVERINASKPDILLVAFGAPRQEKFIFNNADRLNVKIAMGIGGTFDYIADVVPRAPSWMRRMGLEWLYRLFRQPQRVGRIVTATIRFPAAILFNELKIKIFSIKNFGALNQRRSSAGRMG